MDGGPTLAGTDLASTRRCVREALRHLQLHRERCRVASPTTRGVASVFVGYGTGGRCAPDFVAKHSGRFGLRRAATWARLKKAYPLD